MQEEKGIITRAGDFIDGAKVLQIVKDPFIKGQIDIFLDKEESNEFGDVSLWCLVVRRGDVSSQ